MSTVTSVLVLDDKMTKTLESIEKASKKLEDTMRGLDKEVKNSDNAMNSAANQSKSLGQAMVELNQGIELVKKGFYMLKSVMNLSDTYVQTNARLNMMNDGLQTTDELNKMIASSATRSRVSIQSMSDSVAKLGMQAGDAFGSSKEVIAFSENLNKLFTTAGMDANAISSVMYNMTQSLSTGQLLGQDYRILRQNAPQMIQYIQDFYGVSRSELNDLVSAGKVSAQDIKNAIFNATDDINDKFNQMPMTWGQVWTQMKNELYEFSLPLLQFINNVAQNWDKIKPIVLGVAGAILIYKGVLLAANAVIAIQNGLKAINIASTVMQQGATLAEAAATTTATGAQVGLNAALLACPLTWILLIIIAVIAAIYGIVAAINKVTGSTLSATGIIVGSLTYSVAVIWNLFLGLLDLVLGIINIFYNRFVMFANFFGNVFNDPIGAIVHLFGDFGDSILGIIESIAKALDKVFGSSLASAVQGWRSGLSGMVEKVANQYGNGQYEKVAEEINLSSESLGLSRWDYADAWNTGYNWGANLESGLTSGFGFDGLSNLGGLDSEALNDSIGTDSTGGKAVKTTTNDKLLSDEDLQLLLDVATRDYKLNYQKVEPNITITFGDVRETADVDVIMDKVADKLQEIYDSDLEVVG